MLGKEVVGYRKVLMFLLAGVEEAPLASLLFVVALGFVKWESNRFDFQPVLLVAVTKYFIYIYYFNHAMYV